MNYYIVMSSKICRKARRREFSFKTNFIKALLFQLHAHDRIGSNRTEPHYITAADGIAIRSCDQVWHDRVILHCLGQPPTQIHEAVKLLQSQEGKNSLSVFEFFKRIESKLQVMPENMNCIIHDSGITRVGMAVGVTYVALFRCIAIYR